MSDEAPMSSYTLDYSYLVCTQCSLSVRISIREDEDGKRECVARCSSDCQEALLGQVIYGNIPDAWIRDG